MPTYFTTRIFEREFGKLTEAEKKLFRQALGKFIDDLRKAKGFRNSLRIKRYRGESGILEMTWAPNGRALFTYGTEINPGDAHIIWLRIGDHGIF